MGFFDRFKSNPLKRLFLWSKDRYPLATVSLDPPKFWWGNWHLDIFEPDPKRKVYLHEVDPTGALVTLQWSPKGNLGIGVSWVTNGDGYGQRAPDRYVHSEAAAQAEVIWLMSAHMRQR